MKIWREGIINWNNFSFKKTLIFQNGLCIQPVYKRQRSPQGRLWKWFLTLGRKQNTLKSKSCTSELLFKLTTPWDISKATECPLQWIITKELFVKSPHYTPTHTFFPSEAITLCSLSFASLYRKEASSAGRRSKVPCWCPSSDGWFIHCSAGGTQSALQDLPLQEEGSGRPFSPHRK